MSRYPMVDPRAAQGQMFVLSPDGSLSGGFDAIVSLLPALCGLRRLRPLLSPGPVRSIGRGSTVGRPQPTARREDACAASRNSSRRGARGAGY